MTTKPPPEGKLSLDMPFGEALQRLIGVDPAQVQANIAKSKAAKPPGEVAPSPDDPTNVVSLRSARVRKRAKGR